MNYLSPRLILPHPNASCRISPMNQPGTSSKRGSFGVPKYIVKNLYERNKELSLLPQYRKYWPRLRGGAVVARWAHNPKVVRSSRAPATKKRLANANLFFFGFRDGPFVRKWDERSVPAFLFQTFETLVTLITAEILSPLSILSIVPAFTYFNPLIPYNCLYLVRYC